MSNFTCDGVFHYSPTPQPCGHKEGIICTDRPDTPSGETVEKETKRQYLRMVCDRCGAAVRTSDISYSVKKCSCIGCGGTLRYFSSEDINKLVADFSAQLAAAKREAERLEKALRQVMQGHRDSMCVSCVIRADDALNPDPRPLGPTGQEGGE